MKKNATQGSKKRVALGLSGGVDSAVAVVKLQEAGYEVIGVFMECWREPGCRTEEDRADALKVALDLGIVMMSLDLREAFRERVWNYFLEEYEVGRTPNPDVMCNREIKFGLFYDWAIKGEGQEKFGFDKVATGHYARLRRGKELRGWVNLETETNYLLMAEDEWKDQTYFLNQVPRENWQQTLFPLSEMTKESVRALAREKNLAVAEKKDSTGVCMVGEVRVSDFLREKMGEKKGPIIDEKGEQIGEHKGAWFYTLGQRHGLNIWVKTPEEKVLYVVDKNIDDNVIIVGTEDKIYTDELELIVANWQVSQNLWEEIKNRNKSEQKLGLRVRHTGELLPVKEVQKVGDESNIGAKWRLKLGQKAWAISEGQFGVLYNEVIEKNTGRTMKIEVGGGVMARIARLDQDLS